MLDSFFSSLGNLMVTLGLGTPTRRLFFGVVAGFAGQMLIKPSISYNKDGTARSFITSKEKNTTILPWYSWPILAGLLFSLFI